jgi:ATP-dependent helicase/nuclease subunit B
MRTTFLHQFAQRLLEEFPDRLHEVTVVLPTARARLFLMNELKQIKPGPFWTPRFAILPDLVRSMIPGRIGGELEMLMLLFDCYSKTVKKGDNLKDFLRWAGTAIRDFNDVDSAMAPAAALYKDLRNVREIEHWNVEAWSFNNDPLTENQHYFLEFWNQLGELYQAFSEKQDETDCRTYARAVRFLAEHPDVFPEDARNRVYYFVGIAGYSDAERSMLKELDQCADVRMEWDLDMFYLNDQHEAGLFAERHGWKINREEVKNTLATNSYAINIHCGSSAIAQLLRAAEMLSTMSADELGKTCVIVNDDSSLEPLVSVMSDLASVVNLAIGKPLSQTNLSRLAEQLFVIRQSLDKKGSIYFKHFNAYIRLLRTLNLDVEACDEILRQIVRQHIIRVDKQDCERWKEQYPSLSGFLYLLNNELTPAQAVQGLRVLLEALEEEDDLYFAARVKLMELLLDLEQLMSVYPLLNDAEIVLLVYQSLLARAKIYYRGEPVEGLQLMSLSETLALDFETIIVLDANEEFMPGGRFDQSFIPFDLRAFYHLSMPQDRDGIHAYSFYRLLHCARNVHFFYSEISADKKGSEESRYILQLRDELARVNPHVVITNEMIGTSAMVTGTSVVENAPFIQQRFLELLQRGISPSAINKYVQCPLDFYYRYIAGLGEEDEVEEYISSGTFGSILHDVLEGFYKRFVGSFPTEADFKALSEQSETLLRESLGREYSARNVDHGLNYLAVEMGLEMLRNYIGMETERVRLESESGVERKIVLVEKEVSKEFLAERSILDVPIRIKGYVDRVDAVNGTLQILDYKTGKVDKEKSFSKGPEELFKNSQLSKVLQLFAYVSMTREIGKPLPKAGFYSFVTNGGTFMDLDAISATEINHDTMDDFEASLMRWAENVYHAHSFTHNAGSKYCLYCLEKVSDQRF